MFDIPHGARVELIVPCEYCGGLGKVPAVESTGQPTAPLETCPTCGGEPYKSEAATRVQVSVQKLARYVMEEIDRDMKSRSSYFGHPGTGLLP
jgi:hypothetical protein